MNESQSERHTNSATPKWRRKKGLATSAISLVALVAGLVVGGVGFGGSADSEQIAQLEADIEDLRETNSALDQTNERLAEELADREAPSISEEAPSVGEEEAEASVDSDPFPDDELVELGDSGKDQGLRIELVSFSEVDSIKESLERPRSARQGAQLYLATIAVRNDSKTAVSPFCGGGGNVVVDQKGRNYEGESLLNNSSDACEDVDPGFGAESIQVFYELPKSATPEALFLWNDDKFNNRGLVWELDGQI